MMRGDAHFGIASFLAFLSLDLTKFKSAYPFFFFSRSPFLLSHHLQNMADYDRIFNWVAGWRFCTARGFRYCADSELRISLKGGTDNVLPYRAFRSDGDILGGGLLRAEAAEGEMGRFCVCGARFSALRILLAEYSAVGRIRRLEL